jgi:hypothetical protein
MRGLPGGVGGLGRSAGRVAAFCAGLVTRQVRGGYGLPGVKWSGDHSPGGGGAGGGQLHQGPGRGCGDRLREGPGRRVRGTRRERGPAAGYVRGVSGRGAGGAVCLTGCW